MAIQLAILTGIVIVILLLVFPNLRQAFDVPLRNAIAICAFIGIIFLVLWLFGIPSY